MVDGMVAQVRDAVYVGLQHRYCTVLMYVLPHPNTGPYVVTSVSTGSPPSNLWNVDLPIHPNKIMVACTLISSSKPAPTPTRRHPKLALKSSGKGGGLVKCERCKLCAETSRRAKTLGDSNCRSSRDPNITVDTYSNRVCFNHEFRVLELV